MKRLLSVFLLLLAVAAVSGCYYDPGYSYVRGSGQGGDAYYGEGGGTRYVVPAYDGYGAYYGGGYYGCCYTPGVSVGIGSSWYGRSAYWRDDYRGHRDYGSHAGRWQGQAGRDHRPDSGARGSRGSRNSGAHDRGAHAPRGERSGSRHPQGERHDGTHNKHRDGGGRRH